MGNRENEEVNKLVHLLLEDYESGRDIDKMAIYDQPDQESVKAITQKLLRILYPGYYRERVYKSYNAYGNLTVLIEDVIYNLSKQISIVLK